MFFYAGNINLKKNKNCTKSIVERLIEKKINIVDNLIYVYIVGIVSE